MDIQDPVANRAQTKSRRRVRDLAEVFTHEREVNAMLDLVPNMFPSGADPGNTDRTFLEPACGDGNFLVAILARKLRYVTPARYGRGERFEHRMLRCVASIYGIDICADNVVESRDRMRTVLDQHLATCGATEPTDEFREALEAILETNLVCANTLGNGAEVELVAYQPGVDATFLREWSHPLDPAAGQPSLFAPLRRRDEVPVRYSELAGQIEPTSSAYQAAA